MNGRVYDYNLGRFMSVDPFIQAPLSSQSMNAYSYIMNNPMAGVDPTGYMSQEVDMTSQYTDTDIQTAENAQVDVVDTVKVQHFAGRVKSNVTVKVGSATVSNGVVTSVQDLTGNVVASNVGLNESNNIDQGFKDAVDNFNLSEYLQKDFDFTGSMASSDTSTNQLVQNDDGTGSFTDNINFNPTKLLVGVTNSVIAIKSGLQSRVLALVSVVAFGLGQPEIGVPAATLSVWKAKSSVSASKRAGIQIGEAFAEKFSDASYRNLLGVAPFGQHFDDPSEPTPQQFFANNIRDFSVWDIASEIGTWVP